MDRETKSMFIADGEVHVRRALRLALANRPGFTVVGDAGSAESLLAQVCSMPPDAILLDWTLPGIHPARLVSTLREYCSVTKIIATSVKPESKHLAEMYGTDGFLWKQLDPTSFMEALESILNS